jgi:hypothetical protein
VGLNEILRPLLTDGHKDAAGGSGPATVTREVGPAKKAPEISIRHRIETWNDRPKVPFMERARLEQIRHVAEQVLWEVDERDLAMASAIVTTIDKDFERAMQRALVSNRLADL